MLEALGIGPIKQLKKEQDLADQLAGKMAIRKAVERRQLHYPLEGRLSTICEELD